MAYNNAFSPRQVYYKTPTGEMTMYTGEAQTAKFFDLVGEQWRKEPKRFSLGKDMHYTPDFYLPRMRLFVEVKHRDYSTIEQSDIAKIEEFYRNDYDIYIMRKPITEMKFAKQDFQESNGFFFSSRYIHGYDQNIMLVWGCSPDGKLMLGPPPQNGSCPFLRQANDAIRWEFDEVSR